MTPPASALGIEARRAARAARIRDIRSSEKVFYRKVLEIYALSIDYDPNTEETRKFFATVQKKMKSLKGGIDELNSGKVVVKTMDELEAMESPKK